MPVLSSCQCSKCGRPVFLEDSGWMCSVSGTPLILETQVDCGGCGHIEKGPRVFLKKVTREMLKGVVQKEKKESVTEAQDT